MWRLSIVPAPESGYAPCDVVIHAGPEATVADLARALGRHLGHDRLSTPLLAPTTDDRPWPASAALTSCGLRHGAVVPVATVGRDWLDRPSLRRRPTATARVIAGPDAGLEVAVEGQSFTVGRSASSSVQLTDPLVSREHARIVLDPMPVVTDEGSAHGTAVGGRPVRRAETAQWGEPITVGDTTIVLDRGEGTRAAEVSVVRPPRLGDHVEEAEVDLPAPPQAPRPRQMPWTMILMPVVLGAAMFAATRSRFALMYIAVWPVMMLSTHFMQSRQQKKEHAAEVAAWREEVADVLTAIDESADSQRQQLSLDEPRPDELRGLVVAGDPRLWQRQRRHDDHLSIATGLGPVPALRRAKPITSGDRVLRQEVNTAAAQRGLLLDLPVRIPLAEHACVAVVAADSQVRHAALRALLSRLAVTHSPADVAIAAVLAPTNRHVETWLRWLPHTGRRIDGLPPVAIGAGEGVTLLQQAVVDTSFAGDLVIVIDEESGVPVRTVESLVAQVQANADDATGGTAYGKTPRPRIHVLWVGSSARLAPPSSGIVVTLDDDASVSVSDRGGITPLTQVDGLDLATTWHIARSLNSCRDDAALVPPEFAIPELVRLTDLGGDLRDPGDVEGVLARWVAGRGLRAQLGAGADGVVTIDLREDGPHGLVAGTTGSGKSELLQSLICSLAINNPPSRITFLLVDYKGGAAFRECADLPHSVGYITDLTPALVQRALVSLHAELTTREHLLEQYGAKDLVALERSHPEVAPPAMLICIDEFAALTTEVPEFVDGMVSIAQRGRSLGMHMILATQRPAGVVTPQIKANTDLRIALRIASDDDSHDVIDAPDAARLSRRTPGRAWVKRTGHGTTELVQVAFAGARERLRAAQEPVQVEAFTAASTTAAEAPLSTTSEVTDLHPRSDLDRLVTTIGDAFARSGVPAPRKPWLPALTADVQLDATAGVSLTTVDGIVSVEPHDGSVVVGLVDRPSDQTQLPLVVDYAKDGHLLVFGSSGSGKTEALRTIAVSATAGTPTDSAPPYVYALDCGGGGLSVLTGLPSVGSVVQEQNLDRCLRMIRMVHRTVADRNATLAAHGAADIAGLAAMGVALPRVHLLIDNLPALVDAIERGGAARRGHVDQLVQVLQEGRRCGVHVSATTPQRVGLPAAMMACFAQRLVLRMTVDDDYTMLGAPVGVVDRDSDPGRGLHGGHEVQLASLGGAGTPVQGERLALVAAAIQSRYAARPAVEVAAMPTRLPLDVLPQAQGSRVCLAVDADVVGGVWLDLRDGPLTVFGRTRSGRTSFLRAVAGLARASEQPPARVVLIGPRSSEWAGDEAFDHVASEPDDVARALDALTTEADGPGAWTLLLVDDAHEWERGAEHGGNFRDLCERITTSIAGAQDRSIAVVLAGDPDEARQRQHLAGPVKAARMGRRVMLLAPDLSDGTLAGAMVPGTTLEPTSGIGRGVLCTAGTVQVVQVATAPESDALMGS